MQGMLLLGRLCWDKGLSCEPGSRTLLLHQLIRS